MVIPRDAAARCAHRNRSPELQVVAVGDTYPRTRLQAENRIGFPRSGLSIVIVCVKFDRAQ